LKTLAVSLTEYVFNLGKTLWDEFSGRYYPLVSGFWQQFSGNIVDNLFDKKGRLKTVFISSQTTFAYPTA